MIVIYNQPRSGSTLISSLLEHFCGSQNIYKTYHCSYVPKISYSNQYIITVRDPIAAISSWLRAGAPSTDLFQHYNNILNETIKLQSQKIKFTVIKYEWFLPFNLIGLINFLNKQLNLNLSNKEINFAAQDFSIESHKKIIEKLSLFSQITSRELHGKHISDQNGYNNIGINSLKLNNIFNELGNYINFFNYNYEHIIFS